MRVRLVAVGSRIPGWVREAYEDYVKRLQPTLRISLTEIPPGSRGGGRAVQLAMQTEANRLLAAVRDEEYVVALDERGQQLSTRELASWLAMRMRDGRNLTFLIGGADGFAPAALARSDFQWSLSRLTLPHALVRVLVAEQLYRANGVLTNHPYHRD